MEVGQVMDVWEDVETEPESDVSSASEEDAVVHEFETETSDDDITESSSSPSTPPAPPSTTTTRSAANYTWSEVTDGMINHAYYENV